MPKYYQTTELQGGAANATDLTGTGVAPIRRPAVIGDDAATVLCSKGTITFLNATNPILNDVIELAILPADHVPVDWVLTLDQFDSNAAPTFAVTIGMMTGLPGDTSRLAAAVGTEGGSALPCGKGVVASPRYLRNGVYGTFVDQGVTWDRVAPTNADRSVGLFIQAIAATNPATTRILSFFLFYRTARYGA